MIKQKKEMKNQPINPTLWYNANIIELLQIEAYIS